MLLRSLCLRAQWLHAIVTHNILSPRNPHYLLTHYYNLQFRVNPQPTFHFHMLLCKSPQNRMQISKITTASSTLSRSLPSELGKLPIPRIPGSSYPPGIRIQVSHGYQRDERVDRIPLRAEGLSDLGHESHPWMKDIIHNFQIMSMSWLVKN